MINNPNTSIARIMIYCGPGSRAQRILSMPGIDVRLHGDKPHSMPEAWGRMRAVRSKNGGTIPGLNPEQIAKLERLDEVAHILYPDSRFWPRAPAEHMPNNELQMVALVDSLELGLFCEEYTPYGAPYGTLMGAHSVGQDNAGNFEWMVHMYCIWECD